MPKKKKKRRQGKQRDKSAGQAPDALRLAAESRTALSVTVAWTLSLMATLAAEGFGVICQLYVRLIAENEVLTVLGAVMLFVALTAGCMTIVLTPVASRMSKTRPPRILVQVAYLAGALPLVTLLLQYFAN